MSLNKFINTIYTKLYIKRKCRSLSYYVTKIKKNIPFSISRFGDGEWNAILGKSGSNCDGHNYFPKMGEQLRDTIIKPLDYIYSLQNCAIRNDGKQISAFLRKNTSNLTWYNSDVFHYANRDGLLFPLIQALRNKKIVVVGPEHLKNLDGACFQYDKFIEIPKQNCYLALDEIKKRILAYGKNKTDRVYSISASMPANIIIHDLFPILGKKNWLIDFGSVWDIYCGVVSRSGDTLEELETVIQKNIKNTPAK